MTSGQASIPKTFEDDDGNEVECIPFAEAARRLGFEYNHFYKGIIQDNWHIRKQIKLFKDPFANEWYIQKDIDKIIEKL